MAAFITRGSLSEAPGHSQVVRAGESGQGAERRRRDLRSQAPPLLVPRDSPLLPAVHAEAGQGPRTPQCVGAIRAVSAVLTQRTRAPPVGVTPGMPLRSRWECPSRQDWPPGRGFSHTQAGPGEGALTCILQRLEAPGHAPDAGVEAAAPVVALLLGDLRVAAVHPFLSGDLALAGRCPGKTDSQSEGETVREIFNLLVTL